MGGGIGEEVSHGKKITLGDGSIVFELITPTQAFSRQQEDELNGPSGGGEERKWKEEKRETKFQGV